MNWRVLFRPEVQTDVIQAAAWYDSQQPGLGKEFREEVIRVPYSGNQLVSTTRTSAIQLPTLLDLSTRALAQNHQSIASSVELGLSILGIDPVTTVPHVPVSHPFVERLIGTIRREYLNHLFYWNAKDLQRKLDEFKSYFNQSRVHAGIGGRTPGYHAELTESKILSFDNYTWQSHCQGLFEMPEAA